MGVPRNEVLGKTAYDLFSKKKADFITAKDREALKTKSKLGIPDFRLESKTNKERIIHIKKIPILDETGTPQYLLDISNDITDQRLLEAQSSKPRRWNP